MADHAYTREILAAAAKVPPMTPTEFVAFCRRDRDAGYSAEVAAASRKYFAQHSKKR